MTTRDQLRVLEEMQGYGFSVCNCGNCGGIILINNEIRKQMDASPSGEDVPCPHCKLIMAYCDCPDLYFEGSPDVNDN